MLKNVAKQPSTVKDFPGFAINPLFISSYMVLDSFLNDTYNVATLESISQEALNVRYGIMWVQNGSGLGTCYHAGVSMFDYLNGSDVGYPKVPDQLKAQFESGVPWNLTDGEIVDGSSHQGHGERPSFGECFYHREPTLWKRMWFRSTDLELGVCTALAWPKGPFRHDERAGNGRDSTAGRADRECRRLQDAEKISGRRAEGLEAISDNL